MRSLLTIFSGLRAGGVRASWRTLALCVVVLGCGAQTASATPADCDSAPADYTGSDAVVSELRQLRQGVAHTCQALTDRLDLAQVKLDPMPAKLDDLATGLGTLHSDLVGDVGVHLASGAGISSPVSVDTGSTSPSTQTVHLSAADESWFNDNETVMRADLWFLVGLLALLPFAYFFLKTVLP